MQIKHLGVLAALAAVAAAVPHGGQQKALSATNSNTELCFIMCLDEKPKCPPDFHSKKDGLCWTCCRDGEAVSNVNSAHSYEAYPICWRIILREKPECPEGMEPLKEGQFWTCCIKDSDISVSNTVAKSISKTVDGDGAMPICWRALFPEKPQCPEGMEPQNFSTEFWTCCVKDPEQTPLSTFKSMGDPFYGECQKTPCPRMPLNCPEGSEYKRLYGFCGTCCPNDSEEPKHAVAKIIGSSDEFCYIMPSPTLCDGKSRATPYGPMWKCCVDVEGGFKATTKAAVVKSMAGKDDDCLGLCFRNPYEGVPVCRNLGPFMRPTWKGECFDCCTGAGSVAEEKVIKSVAESVESVPDVVQIDQETCLRVIFSEEPRCPPGMHSKKLSENDLLWTCCFDSGQETTKATLKTASVAAEICLKVCFLPEAKCPPDFYPHDPEGFGCRICCTKVGEDAGQTIADL